MAVRGEHFAYFLPDRPSRAGDPLPDPLVTPVDVDVLRQVNMSLTRNLDFCQSGEGSKAWSEVLGLREDFKSHLAWVMRLQTISFGFFIHCPRACGSTFSWACCLTAS